MPGKREAMTVGKLKAILADLPDDRPVYIYQGNIEGLVPRRTLVPVVGTTESSLHYRKVEGAFVNMKPILVVESALPALFRTVEDVRKYAQTNGYPLRLAPLFAMDGGTPDFVTQEEHLEETVKRVLARSPLAEGYVFWDSAHE